MAIRFAAASDPAQETAFPVPVVITQEAEKDLEQTLTPELASQGFSSRQTREVIHRLRSYAALTREWNRQHHAAVEAEIRGQGARARSYDLLAACRKTGVKIKEPQNLDRRTVYSIYARTARKHDHVTSKITGNWFVMACAVILKAYLLLPLSDSYLKSVLPDQDAVRSLVALLLAAVLAYTLTFVARYLVHLAVGMYAPEERTSRRSISDILNRKANKFMFWTVFSMFVIVIGAFLYSDFHRAGNDQAGVVGLSVLFVAILTVFEMYVAYRVDVFQDDQHGSMHGIHERYVEALHCADSEADLAKIRTLALNGQESWHRFLEMVDSGKLAKRPRLRQKAMSLLRGTMGFQPVVSLPVEVTKPILNGSAVIETEPAETRELL